MSDDLDAFLAEITRPPEWLDAFLAEQAEALARYLDDLPPLPSLDDLGMPPLPL